MDDLGRRDHGSAGRRFRRLGAIVGVLAVGLAVGVAPVIGDATNQQATPNETIVPATVPATAAQVSASGGKIEGKVVRTGNSRNEKRQVFIESRITDSESPIITEEGRGTYVGIKCPGGSVAVSGGALTSFINLLISSSAPNQPITGKYTPRMWWLTVTNSNIDGQGGSLAWRGVVNCMSPVKIRSN